MRSHWTNPDEEHKLMRDAQIQGYASGDALKTHADSAHGGVVSESCPACKEIQRKMEFSTGTLKK